MQNNAGACPSRAESGAAHMLYLKGLAIETDQKRDSGKKLLFLVNSYNWVGRPIPGHSRLFRRLVEWTQRFNVVPKRS